MVFLLLMSYTYESCAPKCPSHNARFTGDRNLEMADRWEENALLASVLKNIGNKKSALYELQGFNHGTVLDACS